MKENIISNNQIIPNLETILVDTKKKKSAKEHEKYFSERFTLNNVLKNRKNYKIILHRS